MESPSTHVHKSKRDYNIYGLAWSCRQTSQNTPQYRLGLTSFSTTRSNCLEVIRFSPFTGKFETIGASSLRYPCTKVKFIPDANGESSDILCTTSEMLRFWAINEEDPSNSSLRLFRECKTSAPITSMDWNTRNLNMIGTCSVDTTCTIWDVSTGNAMTQLIAHDSEVYDIAFAPTTDIFASCGADSSIRMFDLRSLSHSTVLFDRSEDGGGALMRLSWNANDHNYLASISADSRSVTVLDIRMATCPVAKLNTHTASVNALVWAPHSSCHIATCSDDKQALIWDLTQLPVPSGEAYLAYSAAAPINNITWGDKDFVAIAYQDTVEVLKI